MTSHQQTVRQQFDPQAREYLDSAVHAAGPDLKWVEQWLASHAGARDTALDVGSGPGHLSFRLAKHYARVCAADPAPAMLATMHAEALRRGLPTIETCVAQAESLPHPACSFDLVATRYSAHHWREVPRALMELRRVLKPAGTLLLLDLLGDDLPLVDTHLQMLEVIRDPGHVRDFTVAEWQVLLGAAGFRTLQFRSWPVRVEFASWVQRMRVPEHLVKLLRELMARAPVEVQQGLAIEPDGSFTPRVGMFLAVRPL